MAQLLNDRSTALATCPATVSLVRDHVDDDSSGSADALSEFSCNICMEVATEAVLCTCGHLFCWHCLYQWLLLSPTCPVCKGGCAIDNVIPIYGRCSSFRAPSQQTARKALRSSSTSLQCKPLTLMDQLLLSSIHPPSLPVETPARPQARRMPGPDDKKSREPDRSSSSWRSAFSSVAAASRRGAHGTDGSFALFGGWSSQQPALQRRQPERAEGSNFNPMFLFAAGLALLVLRQMNWDPFGFSGGSLPVPSDSTQAWRAAKIQIGVEHWHAAAEDMFSTTPTTGKAIGAPSHEPHHDHHVHDKSSSPSIIQ